MSNLSEIQGWKKALLESLGGTYTGLSGKTKDDFGEGKPFITYMNVFSNSKIKPDQVGYVKISEEESQSMVQYGDILFTTSSETVDEVGMTSVMLSKDLDEVYLNSFCFGFRLHDFSKLLPEYASFLFRSEAVRKTITVLSQGSTRFNLSKTALLKKLWLELPPLSEQQKIAEILSTVDEKIEVIEEKINKTQELKKGLMRELLSNGIAHKEFKDSPLGKIPITWNIVNLDTVIQEDRPITYGIVQPGPFDQNGRYLVRGKDYSTGWSDSSDLFRVSDRIEIPYKRARLKANDLITTIVGAGVGNMAVVPEWLDGANITQTTARIAIDKSRADYRFYFHVLSSEIGQRNVRLFEKGGAQPGLNIGDIKKYTVPFPPLNEQIEISRILDTVGQKVDVLIDLRSKYNELKKGLMQQLLTGKIRVNSLLQKETLA